MGQFKTLNPCQQGAYWWIRIIRTKIDDIYRNHECFGKEEQEFLKLFENFDEKEWRKLYIKLGKYIRSHSSNGVFSQSTSKRGHQQINEILSKVLDTYVPDISLSPRQNKSYTLGVYPTKACAIYKTKIKRLRRSYNKSFDYVLGKDSKEHKLYNLILCIIIAIRKKNKEFDSLNFLRECFCTLYLVNDNQEETKAKFNAVIEVLKRYSIIKVENGMIKVWPKAIDGNNLRGYQKMADEYSDDILNEYQYYVSNRVNEPKVEKQRDRKKARANMLESRILAEVQGAKRDIKGPKNIYLKDGYHLQSLNNKIDFNSDGTVMIEGLTPHKQDPRDAESIYRISYSVTSSDFVIEFLTKKGKYGMVSLKDNVLLTIVFDNIEITRNLYTGKRDVIIRYKLDKGPAFVDFYITMYCEDDLIYESVELTSDRTYRFKIENFDNLVGQKDTLLNPWVDLSILSSLSIKFRQMKQGKISHLDDIYHAETEGIDEIKKIIGSLSLSSLSDRVNECLSRLKKSYRKRKKTSNS